MPPEAQEDAASSLLREMRIQIIDIDDREHERCVLRPGYDLRPLSRVDMVVDVNDDAAFLTRYLRYLFYLNLTCAYA